MSARQAFSGKRALVTGASRGIGAAIVQALAAGGCEVVACARSVQALDHLKREATQVLAYACDVREQSSIDSLFETIKKKFGRIDILINNAGIAHSLLNVEQLGAEAWEDVIATNLTGMFLVTRAALPLMQAGGTIVNNLSVAAKGTFAGESAYCASKHGGLGFTNTLRDELRPRGIRVIALMPGPTDTEIWNQFWPEAPREKMMPAETVARAVVNALLLPPECTVEELVLRPTSGAL